MGKYLSGSVSVTSTIVTQFLCFNKSIMIDSKRIFFTNILNKGINYVDQLFKTNGKIERLDQLLTDFSLENKT